MKKKRHNLYYTLISTLLFVACSGDEEVIAFQPTVISIPFAVCETSGTTSSPSPLPPASMHTQRSTGDPGVMVDLPAPRYLYVWLDYVDDGDQHHIHYYTESDIATSWVKHNDDPERWVYQHEVQLPGGTTLKDYSTLQVYAIASQHPLSLPSSVTSPANLSSLTSAVLDLSSWEHSTAAAYSYALGNLYSTPLSLMGGGDSDAAAAGLSGAFLNNGTYTVINDDDEISFLEDDRPTRLYHCAAKADFKWEVAEALQPAVSVSTITLSDLPTQLRVFAPTHNLAASASCSLLAISGAVNPLTIGNKWLGREYAYVLQPPTTSSADDGKLKYNVSFTGGHLAVADRYSSPATNPVFTTWYRINADIKP